MHAANRRYYIVGCDTYLNVDYALQFLEKYDAKEDLWLAKTRYPLTSFKTGIQTEIDLSKYPNRIAPDKQGRFTWNSGATGWFLSNSVAKAFANNLDDFMKSYDVRKVCYCPDNMVTGW